MDSSTNQSRRKLKVNFVDFWEGHVPTEDVFYRVLSQRYDLELSETPDYLFCQRFGKRSLYYKDCIKIERIGENLVPDFNLFDYAVGCDFMEFGDRYLRVPMYAFNPIFKKLYDYEPPNPEQLLNREFCSFVVSNRNGNPLRIEFFKRLSQYKKVASGGRLMNNIGMPNGVPDKMEFISKYKFNIAFENSASTGYTTEKIIQPLSIFSVPIYWGNPLIEKEFSKECFIRVKNKGDVERAVEEIISLDKDDDAYLKRCLAPRLVYEEQRNFDQLLLDFLVRIIEQPKAKARRLNVNGFQKTYRSLEMERDTVYRKYSALYGKVLRPLSCLKRLIGASRKG